ncbi:MAG: hypothetical protein AB7S26_32675 [Sandaracinaceae bacterium]
MTEALTRARRIAFASLGASVLAVWIASASADELPGPSQERANQTGRGIRECAERFDLHGRFDAAVTVDDRGKVIAFAISAHEGELAPEPASCLASVFVRIQFPGSAEGETERFYVPILLR